LLEPLVELFRNLVVYKDKDSAEDHEGNCRNIRFLDAQDALADNQRVYGETDQACYARRNIAPEHAHLNQVVKKMNVTPDKSTKPDVPQYVQIKKICQARNYEAQKELFIHGDGIGLGRIVLASFIDGRKTPPKLVNLLLAPVTAQKRFAPITFHRIV